MLQAIVASWMVMSAVGGAAPVVGGSASPLGRWPDVVAVIGETGLCTGTVIADDLVLTAGHCGEIEPRVVLVGSIDFAHPGGHTVAVTRTITYPRWQDTYDVAVLELAGSAGVAPRAVARTCNADRLLDAGVDVTVVGFGSTARDGRSGNTKLHQAALPVIDASCTTPGCDRAVDPGGEFVAGAPGRDACFGDSGGPVYATVGAQPALLGVVSRGTGQTALPCDGVGVYVRADRVARWIEQVTGRRLTRTTCGAGDGDADSDSASDGDDGGGCDASGGGAAGACALPLAWLLGWAGRRRRHRVVTAR